MIDTLSFGCRLNALESEIMRGRALEAGLGNALLVNTCAVTGEAVRQARQAIRRAKREQPERTIVVSGCAAQIDPAAFAAMPEVDLVLGNRDKLSAASYSARPPRSAAAAQRIAVSDIMAVTETAGHFVDGIEGHTRAFLQVQNGCDHRCTFCAIPYGRGNARSVPVAAALEQARRFVANGYSELVLTGVDLTAYGGDLPDRPSLGRLVRAILAELPGLKRLRLSSIDSVEADAELVAAVADEERLMPHFHLSLQSGDDLILKRMKRRHSRADAIAFAERLRRLRPAIVLGADLIAGFPTETEEAFANSISLVEECGLTFLHVFPFSARPGTPAARMPQLDRAVVRERAGRLRARGEAALGAHLGRETGRIRRVLVERNAFGRTEEFMPVDIDFAEAGAILDVAIAGHNGRALTAAPIARAA